MAKGDNLKGIGGGSFKWVKGQSGNPKGKPKGSQDSKTRLKTLFELIVNGDDPLTGAKGDFTTLQLMDFAMIAKAISGDVAAYNSLLDRFEGKAKQTSDVSINAAHNLRYQIDGIEDFKRIMAQLDDEEKLLESKL